MGMTPYSIRNRSFNWVKYNNPIKFIIIVNYFEMKYVYTYMKMKIGGLNEIKRKISYIGCFCPVKSCRV